MRTAKFKKFTEKYVNLKMSQYLEVAEYISEAMETAHMEDCEESFELIKQMIINNELLSWRMIPDALRKQLKLFSKWIPILVPALMSVILQFSSAETNVITMEEFWCTYISVFFFGVMLALLIEGFTNKTEDLHLRLLKGMTYGQYCFLCKHKEKSITIEDVGVKKEFLQTYQSFVEATNNKNYITLENLKNEKINFVSKDMFSLFISTCLIEDIDTFLFLKDNNFSGRYTDAILRNVCEQVIEYLYILKHEELIPVYLGSNLSEEVDESEDLFTALKKTGKARFGKRKSVKEMAVDIGEGKSSNEKISLYDIFSLKAELEHNSYFHHILEPADKVEGDINESDEVDDDYLYLSYILTAFESISTKKTF